VRVHTAATQQKTMSIKSREKFLTCGIKKKSTMDVTIKISVLDEEPGQFHRMAPKSEVYFNFIEQYILYVRDCEAQ